MVFYYPAYINQPTFEMTDKNLNFRNNDSSVVVKTPTYNIHSWMCTYMKCRSKKDRMAAIKKHNELGTKECIPGICSRCGDDSKTLCPKDPTNIHYNCLNKCCRLLHQWDMCESCVTYRHLKPNQRSNQSEVTKFESVFSRLPDDVKRYICEFVPAITNYITSAHMLFREYGMKYGVLEQHVKLPKEFWTNISFILNESRLYVDKSINSRKKICDFVKDKYKITYLTYMRSIIKDSDFWYHKRLDFEKPKGRELIAIEALGKINKLI